MRPPPVELDGIGGILKQWIGNGDRQREGREYKYASRSCRGSTVAQAHMSL